MVLEKPCSFVGVITSVGASPTHVRCSYVFSHGYKSSEFVGSLGFCVVSLRCFSEMAVSQLMAYHAFQGSSCFPMQSGPCYPPPVGSVYRRIFFFYMVLSQ